MYRQQEVENLVVEFTNALGSHNSSAVYVALFRVMKAFLNTSPPGVVKFNQPESDRELTEALARKFIAHGRGDEVPAEDKQFLEKLGDQFARHMDLWKFHKTLMEFVESFSPSTQRGR